MNLNIESIVFLHLRNLTLAPSLSVRLFVNPLMNAKQILDTTQGHQKRL